MKPYSKNEKIEAVKNYFVGTAALDPKRKWLTAIVFGFLGLLFSPYSFSITIGEVLISMPWSITFPILIAMAYGAKFGFIAGVSGSAFYPFLLWTNNGYPNVMNFVILLGLFTSIGIISYSKTDDKYSEILPKLFLILAVNIVSMWILYHFLFIPLLSLNPPFWEANSIRSINYHLLTTFAIKDSVNFVLIALLAETLLRLPLVRQFLGLPSSAKMKLNHSIFIFSLSVTVLIGLILIVLDFALLKTNDHDYYEFLLFVFMVISWGGIIVARIIIVLSEKRFENENELQRACNQIKENQENLNALLNALPDLIFVFDSNYIFLDIYSNDKDSLYVHPEEFIGKKVAEVLPPEVANQSMQCIDKTFATGELQNQNYSLPINGEIKYFEARFVLKGEKTCLSIVSEVTEQKRTELERRVLYEINHGVTTTKNLNELLKLIHQSLGKVLYAENCFIALYDKKTELFGFPYFVDKFDPTPEPHSMYKSCTAYIFKTGKPLLLTQELFDNLVQQNEVELVGTNSPSWIGVPLITPEKTIGVLVLQHYEEENIYSERDVQFLDSVGSQIAMVIERKRAEDELHESEEMFRRLFDESADPTLLLDETGFTNCNQATVILLGYSSKEEFLYKKPWELSPKRQPDGLLSSEKAKMMIDKAIAEGYNRFEWIHSKLDGSDVPVDVMLTPIQLKGKQILYTVWRDISVRKRAEEEIKKRNNELLMTNAEKDKFFSIIAHDLRSPFQGFLGMTEVMSENVGEFSIEELVKLIGDLNKSAQNLYKLLQNLLEWAQLKKGSTNFTPEELPLSITISGCVEQINKRAIQKGITITNEVPGEQKVFADERMLNSITSNLLSNAVKFTRKEGKVSITAHAINGGMVEVAVHDTGVGISEGVVNKLFKIDEKIGSEGTDGELSTGLGLLLCKEFVEKHGGKIWVESAENIGSTFYFTMPVRK